MKINKSTACSQCRKAYVTSKESQKHKPTGQHDVFVTTKEFSWAKYGLVIPSAALYDLWCVIERIVQMNMEGIMAGPRVMGCLKDMVQESVTVDSYYIDVSCDNHQSHWLNKAITIYLRVRIHHFVRVRNREPKELAEKRKSDAAKLKLTTRNQKRNRKAKKVKHL